MTHKFHKALAAYIGTDNELAEALGLSISDVSDWRAGRNAPQLEMRQRVMRWLLRDLNRHIEAMEERAVRLIQAIADDSLGELNARTDGAANAARVVIR